MIPQHHLRLHDEQLHRPITTRPHDPDNPNPLTPLGSKTALTSPSQSLLVPCALQKIVHSDHDGPTME